MSKGGRIWHRKKTAFISLSCRGKVVCQPTKSNLRSRVFSHLQETWGCPLIPSTSWELWWSVGLKHKLPSITPIWKWLQWIKRISLQSFWEYHFSDQAHVLVPVHILTSLPISISNWTYWTSVHWCQELEPCVGQQKSPGPKGFDSHWLEFRIIQLITNTGFTILHITGWTAL